LRDKAAIWSNTHCLLGIAFSRRQRYQAFMISQHIQLAQGTYYRRS